MTAKMEEFLLEQTEELTFLALDLGELLDSKNISMKQEVVDIPILLEDLNHNLQKNEQEFMLTTEIIVKGIGYLLGVDPDFKYRDEYVRILKSLSPDIAKALLVLGNNTFDQGEKIKGMIFIKGSTTLNPNDPKTLFNYAVSLLTICEELRSRKEDQNVTEVQKRIDTFQEEAKVYLERLIELDSNHALGYYHLGFLYKKDSLFQKAQFIWKKALQNGLEEHLEEHVNTLLREIEDLVQYEKGYQLILQGELSEGLKELLELEDRYPQWWNLLFFIGLAYRQLEQYAKGITYFQRVLELEERISDPYVEIALSYAGLGKYEKSIEYFEKVLQKDPKNSEILSNLAMVNIELGDLNQAEKFIKESLKLDPTDEITIACREQLLKLKKNSKEK